jgi:hypothetical protein
MGMEGKQKRQEGAKNAKSLKILPFLPFFAFFAFLPFFVSFSTFFMRPDFINVFRHQVNLRVSSRDFVDIFFIISGNERSSLAKQS